PESRNGTNPPGAEPSPARPSMPPPPQAQPAHDTQATAGRPVMPIPAELAPQLAQIWSGRSDLAPDPKDRRFQDPVWASNPFYKAWLQSYLAWGNWFEASVADARLEPHANAQANFVLEQIRDAM